MTYSHTTQVRFGQIRRKLGIDKWKGWASGRATRTAWAREKERQLAQPSGLSPSSSASSAGPTPGSGRPNPTRDPPADPLTPTPVGIAKRTPCSSARRASRGGASAFGRGRAGARSRAGRRRHGTPDDTPSPTPEPETEEEEESENEGEPTVPAKEEKEESDEEMEVEEEEEEEEEEEKEEPSQPEEEGEEDDDDDDEEKDEPDADSIGLASLPEEVATPSSPDIVKPDPAALADPFAPTRAADSVPAQQQQPASVSAASSTGPQQPSPSLPAPGPFDGFPLSAPVPGPIMTTVSIHPSLPPVLVPVPAVAPLPLDDMGLSRMRPHLSPNWPGNNSTAGSYPSAAAIGATAGPNPILSAGPHGIAQFPSLGTNQSMEYNHLFLDGMHVGTMVMQPLTEETKGYMGLDQPVGRRSTQQREEQIEREILRRIRDQKSKEEMEAEPEIDLDEWIKWEGGQENY